MTFVAPDLPDSIGGSGTLGRALDHQGTPAVGAVSFLACTHSLPNLVNLFARERDWGIGWMRHGACPQESTHALRAGGASGTPKTNAPTVGRQIPVRNY